MITVDRFEYRWSHGKQPRGYGLWAFRLRDGGSHGRVVETFMATDTYGNALRRAKAQAKRVGASCVTVCS